MYDRRDYRARIYGSYVTARDQPLAPETVEGLKSRLPYLYRLIQMHLPENRDAAILDLGCGHGALVYALESQGYQNVTGVDGSPEQVDAAHRLGIRGVRLGDAIKILVATEDASLDAVIAFDFIEHFQKPEIVGLVDEIHRVLKPGGRSVFHVPNAEGPFGANVRYGDFTHEQAFTRSSIVQLLKSSGFSDVFCFEDTPAPHGLKSAIRAAFWAVFRLGLLFFVAVETGAMDREAIFSMNLLAVALKGMQ
jgi:SAM-dependent methyltransferase